MIFFFSAASNSDKNAIKGNDETDSVGESRCDSRGDGGDVRREEKRREGDTTYLVDHLCT